MATSATQPSLKSRVLRLLSAREHSRAELQRKLAPFDEPTGALAAVLDELQAKGFINEQRVLESVLHRRADKLGAARIRQELQAKGLANDAVLLAMDQLLQSEHARARAVWRKKFGCQAQDAAEQAKQIRFLVGRGFAPDVVRKVVGRTDED